MSTVQGATSRQALTEAGYFPAAMRSLLDGTAEDAEDVFDAFDALTMAVHLSCVEAGWWDEPRDFPTLIALMHSELSEALEADRKGLQDDHLPQYEGRMVELIDLIIRAFDTIYALYHEGARMGDPTLPSEVLRAKWIYNRQRADHKPENRAKDGGKSY